MSHPLRERPKIDSHHHLWNIEVNPYPWLTKPSGTRMYGRYEAICKNYLIEDFLRDSAPHNVVKSVHVQANWDSSDPLGETQWVQEIANQHGFPHAIVAHTELQSPQVEAALEAHRAYPNLRGIRQIIGHTDDPGASRGDRPNLLADPNWEMGYAALARFNLSFDLQAFPRQLLDAVHIVRRHPEIPVVICHAGFPWDRSEAGIEEWRNAMSAFCELPHAYAKLSGPGMVMRDWTVDSFGSFIHETLEMFGPTRCMFASNVPPDSLSKSYDQIYEGFYAWAESYTEIEQAQMFYGTAASFYKI